MSMRALVLLIGLLVTGDAGAAVNAPLSVEPRGAEPREDLFASKPRSAAPAATPALPAPPAAPATERAPTGNPLWAIPLSRLPATRERPLFSPTRQPAAVAAVARPAPAPMAPPPKPAEPETPQLSLLGTIAGGGRKIGLFIDSASKAVLTLNAGENHKGWILRAVSRREVELARGLDTAVLVLAPPDMKAGAAPPVVPAVAVAPAVSGPAVPVNTASATGAPHKATPLGVQRPVFQPRAEQVNPFQQPNPFGRMPGGTGSR
jgi:general secretion pathway protein N